MIVLSKTIYKTPYIDLLPPLTESEYQGLREHIQEHGVLVPVVIDEDRNVIDGHNRLRLALELGIENISFDIRSGLAEEEKRQLALDLNLHRRHLDKEQRAGFALRMRQNGMSYRAIGERLGISHTEAKRDIEEGGTNVTPEESPKVKGKDGKQYPAKKKKKTSVFASTQKQANQVIKNLGEVDTDNLPDSPLTANDIKREAKRQQKRAQREAVEAAELPPDTYHVLAVDPPWSYGRQNDPTHRSANPYSQMSVEEICAFPVATLAHDDCILWLWTTNAYMGEAYQVAEAWGFEVKTILTWVKDRMGTGDWLRGQTEHCLMAIKGRPVVNLTNQTTVIYGPLREHSRKPDEFFELVNTLCPGKKAELFAREAREGWTVYGNQLHAF